MKNKICEVKYFLEEPINCFIHEKFLYNMDETKSGIIPCKVIALCSYKKHQITFDVLLNNGSQFCYMPIESLIMVNSNLFKYESLFHIICPSNKFFIHKINEFENLIPHIFNKNKQFLYPVKEYILSIEWHTNNELVHLFNNEKHFILVPNHKVMWLKKINTEIILPDYKAIHKEWK